MLPEGTTFVSATGGGEETEAGSGIVVWSVPAANGVLPGQTQSVSLTVRVDNLEAAPFTNTAEISADAGVDEDSTPDAVLIDDDNVDDITDVAELDTDTDSNDPDEDDHDIAVWDPSYDLALANLLTDVDPTGEATQLTYEITIKNQSDLASRGFSVTDRLARGTTFVSATEGGEETEEGSGVIEWTFDAEAGLLPNATKTLTVVVQVADESLAPFINTAEISADAGVDDDSTPNADLDDDNLVDITDVAALETDTDSNEPDEDDHDIASWTPAYDLALANLLGGFSEDGQQITYEITVANQG